MTIVNLLILSRSQPGKSNHLVLVRISISRKMVNILLRNLDYSANVEFSVQQSWLCAF